MGKTVTVMGNLQKYRCNMYILIVKLHVKLYVLFSVVESYGIMWGHISSPFHQPQYMN